MKSEMFLGMAMKSEIKTLADYIKEPSREPLIGLEYVVEHRTPGKKTPTYSCELCDYKTELAPIVQHLIGFKHRKAYIGKEFPFLLKTPPGIKEDRVQFLRRMAQDIEKDEGVKTYKIDPGPKPEPLMSVKMSIERLKPKTRWDLAKNEKNSQNERALKFLETFEIDTDAEAFSVMTITEELSRTLKGYCFKQKAISKANEINVAFANRIKSEKWAKEARLAKQFTKAASQAIAQAAFLTRQYNSVGNIGLEGTGVGNQNPMIQNQQDDLAISETDHRDPDYMMENQQLPYNSESENLNQRFKMQNHNRSGDRNWNRKLVMQDQQGHNGFENQGLNLNPMVMQNQGGSYGFEDGSQNRDSLMQTQREDYNSGGRNKNKIQYAEGNISQESMMHNQQVQPVLRGSGEDIWNPDFGVQEQIQFSSGINLSQEPVVLNRQAQQMKIERALRSPDTLLYPVPPFGSSPGLSSLDNIYNLDLPSTSTSDMSSYVPGGHFEDSDLRRASRIQDYRRPFSGMDENWRQKPKQSERRDLPGPRVYHTAVPSDFVSDEDVLFRFGSRPKRNDMLAKYASGRPLQNYLELHMIADPPLNFLHDPFRRFPEDPRFGKITERHSMNLPPEIVNQVRGKDIFTATAILKQLAWHYPELQRLNISNLVKVLIDNGVIV